MPAPAYRESGQTPGTPPATGVVIGLREWAMFVGGMFVRMDQIQEAAMLDRQKLETILLRRFPGATVHQIAVSANAIMGLDDEWEDVPVHDVDSLNPGARTGRGVRSRRRRDACRSTA